MKNPKHYLYQIYPDYNKEKNDEFDLTILNACHIIKYKDYIFINSFDENELNFENINFKGRFCAVLKYESDDEISLHISTGKRIKTNINFAIEGYHRCSSNTRLKTNLISINDELVHKFKFKKNLDK
jgi:NAD-specific glutamate dehydrogenase